MPTYLNAYELLKKVRLGLQEYTDALLTGQLPGTHPNEYLMDEINAAQLHIYGLALKRSPGHFIAKADLTGVDSVFTLPADYGSLIVFKDTRKRKVERVSLDNLTPSTTGGSKNLYYQKGRTFVVDYAGLTDTYELWYRKKPRDIHAGRVSADGTNAITLDSRYANLINDYYNGMYIEDANSGVYSEISDYVGSTRIATISGNSTHGDFYGLVSDLPEVFHPLIYKKALINIRTSSPLVKGKITKADLDLFTDELVTTFQAWSDYEEDVDDEELFTDFAPQVRQWGIVPE